VLAQCAAPKPETLIEIHAFLEAWPA